MNKFRVLGFGSFGLVLLILITTCGGPNAFGSIEDSVDEIVESAEDRSDQAREEAEDIAEEEREETDDEARDRDNEEDEEEEVDEDNTDNGDDGGNDLLSSDLDSVLDIDDEVDEIKEDVPRLGLTFDEDVNNLSIGRGNEGNHIPFIVIPDDRPLSGVVWEHPLTINPLTR